MLYMKQDRYKEAENGLFEVVKRRGLKLGGTHPYTQESLNNLIELYGACGKPEKAEKWRSKLPKTEAVDE